MQLSCSNIVALRERAKHRLITALTVRRVRLGA